MRRMENVNKDLLLITDLISNYKSKNDAKVKIIENTKYIQKIEKMLVWSTSLRDWNKDERTLKNKNCQIKLAENSRGI